MINLVVGSGGKWGKWWEVVGNGGSGVKWWEMVGLLTGWIGPLSVLLVKLLVAGTELTVPSFALLNVNFAAVELVVALKVSEGPVAALVEAVVPHVVLLLLVVLVHTVEFEVEV